MASQKTPSETMGKILFVLFLLQTWCDINKVNNDRTATCINWQSMDNWPGKTYWQMRPVLWELRIHFLCTCYILLESKSVLCLYWSFRNISSTALCVGLYLWAYVPGQVPPNAEWIDRLVCQVCPNKNRSFFLSNFWTAKWRRTEQV